MSDNDISPQFGAVDAIMTAWKHREIEPVLEQLSDEIEFTFAIGKRPLVGKASDGGRRGRRTDLAVGRTVRGRRSGRTVSDTLDQHSSNT